MLWQVGWSLALGFIISALLQTLVSRGRMTAALGGNGLRQTALASFAGAASSSCSYAAAAVSRTLFKNGAGLVPSLAFLLASTNLVVELGLVLYLLMGWQFMAGEWLGGVVLVIIMSLLVHATYPAKLIEAARTHGDAQTTHQHGASPAPQGPWAQRLLARETWITASHHFVMDWRMLWKDLLIGFLIAGALSSFVPMGVWQILFIQSATPWVQAIGNALIGPLVAMLSFVCSIGNVPMAAVLWGSGVSFGGVLAFLFADLIVFPLLDVYRRYYGWKMAAYIGVVFYVAMVIAALIMDGAFHLLGWVPTIRPMTHASMASFSFNYSFYLNLIFGVAALALFIIARRNPVAMAASCCAHHAAPAAKPNKPTHGGTHHDHA